MGLDMYLGGEKFYWTDWENPKNNKTEDGFKMSTLQVELGYWRKHPNLHGFIVQTFAQGVDKCQRIDLYPEYVDKILLAITKKELPKTEGFFFGESDGSEDDETIDIFKRALEWQKTEEKGVSRQIYYKASW